MAIYRGHPELPFPFRGVWALLHSVLGDGAAARAEVRGGPQLTSRANWVLLGYADAVALGRAGQAAHAVETFTDAAAAGPYRVSASTSTFCGWWAPQRCVTAGVSRSPGCGRRWTGSRRTTSNRPRRPAGGRCARPVSRCHDAAGGRGRARRAAQPRCHQPRDGRAAAGGRRAVNPEIAASLVLSPRTVEKHVASLLTRTGAVAGHSSRRWPPATRLNRGPHLG